MYRDDEESRRWSGDSYPVPSSPPDPSSRPLGTQDDIKTHSGSEPLQRVCREAIKSGYRRLLALSEHSHLQYRVQVFPQLDGNMVNAGLVDGLLKGDLPLVHHQVMAALQLGGDIGGGYRAVEPFPCPDLRLDDYLSAIQLRRQHRQSPREKEVPSVAISHVFYLARPGDRGNILQKYHLHIRIPSHYLDR